MRLACADAAIGIALAISAAALNRARRDMSASGTRAVLSSQQLMAAGTYSRTSGRQYRLFFQCRRLPLELSFKFPPVVAAICLSFTETSRTRVPRLKCAGADELQPRARRASRRRGAAPASRRHGHDSR